MIVPILAVLALNHQIIGIVRHLTFTIPTQPSKSVKHVSLDYRTSKHSISAGSHSTQGGEKLVEPFKSDAQ